MDFAIFRVIRTSNFLVYTEQIAGMVGDSEYGWVKRFWMTQRQAMTNAGVMSANNPHDIYEVRDRSHDRHAQYINGREVAPS